MIALLVLACCIDGPAWQNPREGKGQYMETYRPVVEGSSDALAVQAEIDAEVDEQPMTCEVDGTISPCPDWATPADPKNTSSAPIKLYNVVSR